MGGRESSVQRNSALTFCYFYFVTALSWYATALVGLVIKTHEVSIKTHDEMFRVVSARNDGKRRELVGWVGGWEGGWLVSYVRLQVACLVSLLSGCMVFCCKGKEND